MTNAEQLPAEVLRRKAIVYVRQSTQTQVQNNLEGKRRQYDLVAEARRRGFTHGSSTWTACTTHVGPTTGCCWA